VSTPRRCPDCAMRHPGGRCHPLPMWPTRPVVEFCGGQKALYRTLGWATNHGKPPTPSKDSQASRGAAKAAEADANRSSNRAKRTGPILGWRLRRTRASVSSVGKDTFPPGPKKTRAAGSRAGGRTPSSYLDLKI
jgi:hypothetical protein